MRTISDEQVIGRLGVENPWWKDQSSIANTYGKWTPRPYLNLFYPLVQNRSVRRAVVLMGPRRVGKTFLIHHTIQKLLEDGVAPNRICYFSVDHPIYNGLSLEQFLEFYQNATGVEYTSCECFVFFDEIQYLKGWENHLKSLVDTYPSIKCTVSGSAAAALRLKSLESGAGRFTDFLLPPLTFHEYLSLLRKDPLIQIQADQSLTIRDQDELNNEFFDYLNFGGYPEVIFSKEIQADPGRFIKSDIIDKVLLRDLPSLYGIQDIQELNYLFTTLAFNTGGEVSLDELSKGSGVSKNTIKRYIEYLEAAFLIRVVHRVDRSARRFKRANRFKVYLTNPSMRSALYSAVESDDEAVGSLVETAIFSQWFHSEVPLHYARWKQGEIDIVSLGPEQQVYWALEVKWSDRYVHNLDELNPAISFCHGHNLPVIWITTRSVYTTKVHKNVQINFIPSSAYCYYLGEAIVRNKLEHLKKTLAQGYRDIET